MDEVNEQLRKHNRQLLSDIIAEYAGNDNLTPDNFIEDLAKELTDWIDYHSAQKNKLTQMYEKFHRTIDRYYHYG